jgi:CRP-like cAMP-binding protein
MTLSRRPAALLATKRRRIPVPFDPDAFLTKARVKRSSAKYANRRVVFAQGDLANSVFYIEEGAIRLSVLSKTGREAVIGMLGAHDFFGEGCLAGQTVRMGTATVIAPSTISRIARGEMVRLLRREPALAERFLAHMLTRNIRIEEDLVDQLFNSSEKRLARALLLLAHYGEADDTPVRQIPALSQEVLAEIVGTTRSRVNFFMNKFRKLGFIEYNGGIKININKSLLSVVLHD